MDIVTIIIGMIIAVYGIYTLYARIKTPEQLGKLEAMKEKFGLRVGLIVHTIGYSFAPIVIGALVVYAGLNGVSLIQLLKA